LHDSQYCLPSSPTHVRLLRPIRTDGRCLRHQRAGQHAQAHGGGECPTLHRSLHRQTSEITIGAITSQRIWRSPAPKYFVPPIRRVPCFGPIYFVAHPQRKRDCTGHAQVPESAGELIRHKRSPFRSPRTRGRACRDGAKRPIRRSGGTSDCPRPVRRPAPCDALLRT